MHILVKFPTRGRPKKFQPCLSTWFSTLSGDNEVHFLVSLHDDDETRSEVMNYPYVLPTGASLEFAVGHIKTKIEAANYGLAGRRFDLLVQGMDDLYPLEKGWDQVMAHDAEYYFPGLDGVINYWDGHRPDYLPVVFSIGWNYFRRFPYLWCPEYVSVYGDNDLQQIATQLHKFTSPLEWRKERNHVLMDHRHPYWMGEPFDDILKHTESFYGVDGATFNSRRGRNFGLKTPKLSILICAIHKRREMLKTLLDSLYAQVFNLPEPQDVEILYSIDDKEMSIGEKRNLLMSIARGEYVCFVDDDDRVSGDYIPLILRALDTKPDCVSIMRMVTFGSVYPLLERSSLAYRALENATTDAEGIRKSFSYHLCPMKRSIASSVKFPDLSFNEDLKWGMEISPLLKTMVPIQLPCYHYNFFFESTETQKDINKTKREAKRAVLAQRRAGRIRGGRWVPLR